MLRSIIGPLTRGVTAIAFAVTLAAATAVSAQVAAGAPPSPPSTDALHLPPQNVTVYLLTMGNGDLLWELFGHTAIMIRDNTSGRDTVFNWGVFDSQKPNFILHFLQGLNWYQMGGETLKQLLNQYRYQNRTVVAQELDLAVPQRDSLLRSIQVNARPENLEYRYDYFRNNCSTQPRDLLDRALGGQLRAKADSLTSTTYRSEALRLMQGDKLLITGVDIGLGEPADEMLTAWTSMFLPRRLHDFVGGLQVRDSTGAMHPLVRGEQVLFQSTRGPEAAAPPRLASWLLLIGLFLAGLIVWTASRAGRRGAARVTLTIVTTTYCVIAGLLGVVLTLLWTATDHIFAHANENLLVFNPLWLVLGVLAAVYFNTGRAARVTGYLAMGLAGLCVLALLSHMVFVSRQANLAIILLALPPALVIAWLTAPPRRELRRPSS
jgi:Domain of unknown function (DUF4105)